MKKYISESDKQTKEIASDLAKQKEIKVIALSGGLGAGKTTFVQGFAKGLEIEDKIISPTFVLIRQHKIPDSKKVLYHIDLYRMEDKIETKELGLEELFTDPNAIVLIEWAEKIKDKLPKGTLFIKIEKLDGDNRKIMIYDL